MSDSLSVLLEQLSLKTGVFYSGKLCGLFEYGEQNAGHLHILKAGKLRFLVSGQPPIELTEPSLVFFPSAIKHTMSAQVSDDAEVICATVQYGIGIGNVLTNTLPPSIVTTLSRIPAIKVATNGLIEEANNEGRAGNREIMNRFMEVFLIAMLRDLIEHQHIEQGVLAGLANPAMSRALHAMHSQPAHRWSLQTLAEQACQSRSKFADEFKRIIGMPALEYLTHCRVNIAKALLISGKQVGFIAAEVGYDTPSSFTKAFKKVEGCPPKTWLSDAMAA